MTQTELKQIFETFSEKTVLVIGDVMVDSYMWGEVNRISPEAPVPILSCSKTESRLGGAANVVLNIKALGAKPITCSVIGDDETAAIFRHRMQTNGLTQLALFSSPERPTTRKTRMIGNQQQLLRVDEETTTPIAAELEEQFIAHTLKVLNEQAIDVIIFEDYDKGAVTPRLIEAVVDVAQKNEIPTLVDPKKRNFLAYKGVNLFKPNFKELREGLGRDIKRGDLAEIDRAAKYLIKQYQQQYVMVTLSELGVFVASATSTFIMPAQVRDIADVSGAGDTVISIASLCLAAGMPANWVAHVANIGGGLVCEKVGVVPIDKENLLVESLKLIDK